MSGNVTLTAAMRANLLSLQGTGSQMATTQLALSTGNKVNSALDNPVEYFASQSLNSRASALSALLDGMGQAVSAIQATSQGITSITALVNQLTSIVNQATQDLQTVTTQNILAGTLAASGLSSAAVSSFVTADAGTLSLNSLNPAASFTVTAGEALQTIVNQINASGNYSASIVMGTGANLVPGTAITATAGLAYLDITSLNGGGAISTTNSTALTLTGLGIAAASTAVATGGAAADQANYASVMTQINQLVTDSNYQGNNLIAGAGGNNMTVDFSTVGSSITVNKVDLTTGATGLNLASQNITTTGGITAAQAAIASALNSLQTASASFSNSLSVIQARQDFTSNLVNTLQNGATELVIADKNEEGANMLALQTQQQLGIEALSLSSQANQSVLRLFA